MIPNISRPGSSFRGAAKYYFHDKAQDPDTPDHLKPKTDDRVSFFVIRNCAALDPDDAVDEMWRTAEMQQRLKQQAGVRAGGRACENPVQTVSLSWHPNQNPTPEHMIETADLFMKFMGASEHQAVYVGHNDTDHLHIHILMNRVHPETGRTHNNYNDFLRAQDWAKQYEIDTREIFCEKRFTHENDNSRSLPPNVIEMAKPHEQAFKAETQAQARSEFDLLREVQKQERLAFVAESKRIYAQGREAAFEQVRSEYKAQWKSFYDEQKRVWDSFDVHNKELQQQAHHELIFNHDPGAARRMLDQSEADRGIVESMLQAEKNDLLTRQKAATQQAQAEACDLARLKRDELYKTVLERQQRERDDQRAFDKNRVNDPGLNEGKASPLSEILAARAVNENLDPAAHVKSQGSADIDPVSPASKGATELITAPKADAKAPEGPAVPVGLAEHLPGGGYQSADAFRNEEREEFKARPEFTLSHPKLAGLSGTTLEEMQDILHAIPRSNVQEVFTVGLAMHHEYQGADPAYGLFAHWAGANPFFRDAVAADLWEQAGTITQNPRTIEDIQAIAAAYEFTPHRADYEQAPLDHGSQAFGNAPDVAAGAIGQTANYIADQMGEFFAPSTPAELAARGRAFEVAQEVKFERQQAMNEMFVQYADRAMRTVEEERLQERDEAYWQDYERRRDRDR